MGTDANIALKISIGPKTAVTKSKENKGVIIIQSSYHLHNSESRRGTQEVLFSLLNWTLSTYEELKEALLWPKALKQVK